MTGITRLVLSTFVAIVIFQAAGISKVFADCPPNCSGDPVKPRDDGKGKGK
jgi:hypothetical protein